MGKLYQCNFCDKRYKNSGSLRTHKYSYHSENTPQKFQDKPYSKTTHNVFNSDSLLMKGSGKAENTLRIPKCYRHLDDHSLETVKTGELDDKVSEFDCQELKTMVDTVKFSLQELDFLVKSNKIDINELRQARMRDRKNTEQLNQKEIDLRSRDLVDNVIEMESLIAAENVEEIKSDIPKVRQVINFILKNMDLSEISEKDINLLTEFTNFSKAEVKDMIDKEFMELVKIFGLLKPEFEQLLYSENEDSSDSDTDSRESSDKGSDDDDENSENNIIVSNYGENTETEDSEENDDMSDKDSD